MSEVVLHGLHKRYGDNEVVRGVSLHIADGEIMCLLGPSGCGKTTTLRMVAGLEVPTAGRVTVGGQVCSGPGIWVPPERRRLGMVFQTYAIWPHMTVFDNVLYPLISQGVPRPQAKLRATESLQAVHMGELGHRYPHELSGGQQQRVALARAIAPRPDVLLLDEPLSNLDAKLRDQMRDELRALVKAVGLTVLLVTHDQEEALGLADHIAVMDHGVVQQVDTPSGLYTRPANALVARFIGTLNELPGLRAQGGVEVGGSHIEAHATTDAPAEGQAILGFRPEDARVAGSGLSGTVTGRTYLGHTTRYAIDIAGTSVLVDDRAARVVGERVHIHIERGLVLGPKPPAA